MRARIELLKDNLAARDVVDALEALRDDAGAGRLVGLAFAAQFRGRVYVCHVAGESYRNPTFALGMVHMLEDYIREIIREPK